MMILTVRQLRLENKMKSWMKLFSLALLPACIAHANTLNGKLTGDDLTWINAMPEGEYLTLSTWQPIANMPTTTEWVPGTFTSPLPSTITLRGPAGEVSAPIDVVGVGYNLGGNDAPTESSDNNVSATSCSDYKNYGSVVSIADETNSTCVAPYSLVQEGNYTPFYFVRPIISIDETAFIEAFGDVDSGHYSGSMTLPMAYYYKTGSGVQTYRLFSMSFSVGINYIASFLSDVVIDGNGFIEPTYDTTERSVSGSTKFDVTATGSFSNGLSIEFPQDEFEITNTKSDTSIPLNISCDLCEDIEISSDGEKLVDETIVDTGVSTNEILFSFDVGFEDVSAADIESGTYSGEIVLIFKENL